MCATCMLLFSPKLVYRDFSNIPYFTSHIHLLLPVLFLRICPIPSSCVTFHYNLIFYSEVFLAPCPTFKLEDHPLSGCL
jgi:hypothetical protein